MTKCSAQFKANFETISLTLDKQNTIYDKLECLLHFLNNDANLSLDKKINFHRVFRIFKDKYFQEELDLPEFTFWFLKYNAITLFNNEVNSEKFKLEINHSKSQIFLQRRLNNILHIENTADKQLLENNKQIVNLKKDESKLTETYRKKGFLHFSEEQNNITGIEYYRVIGNYYETNPTEYNYITIKSPEVKAYCKHILLKPYLEEQIMEFNQFHSKITSKPQQITKKSLIECQNNLITQISIDEVFNHFECLTKETARNNIFYLTNEQLLIFIKSTFIDKKPIKQKFNCDGFIKKDVRTIFYNFYINNRSKERNFSKLKRKYYDIMNDAFEGFNKNDYTDFAK